MSANMFKSWVAAQHGYIDAEILDDRVPWLCPDCNGNGGPWPENPTICGGHPCPVCDGVCLHENAPTIAEVLEAGELLIMARRDGGGLFVKAPCDEDVDW